MITRKIERMTLDLEIEGQPKVMFTSEPVNFNIEGQNPEDIERKTDELRKKLRSNLSVLFPRIVDVREEK